MKTHLTYEFVQSLIFGEEIEKLEMIFTKVPNIDVNYTDKNGYSLLCFAIHFGKLKSVQFLIEKGADIHQKNPEFYSEAPLHLAARDFNAEIIQALLSAGADINALNTENQTPLIFALGHEKADIALFKDAGADLLIQDKYNKTALHYAAQAGHIAAIQDLLAAGLDLHAQDDAENNVLHYAARAHNHEALQLLIAAGANIEACDMYGHTPLHIAAMFAEEASSQKVAILIAAGANIHATSKDEATPLCMAVQAGSLEAVQALVAAGADIHAKRTNPILSMQFNMKFVNDTLLHKAAINGHAHIVAFLLEKGIEINAQDDISASALHYATAAESFDVVKLLVAAGANLNIVDKDNATPLHVAIITHKNNELIQYLIDAGADINMPGKHGNTLLHYAVKDQNIAITKLLIRAGVNRSLANDGGKAAVHYAKSKKIRELLA